MQSKSTTPTRQHLIAWAAGFIDGEGSVLIDRYLRRRSRAVKPRELPQRTRYTLSVSAVQVKIAPLLRLQGLFGGNLNLKRRPEGSSHQDVFRWQVVCSAAADMLRETIPFLTVKAEAAQIALEFQAMMGPHRVGYRMGPGEQEARDAKYQRLRAVNRVGRRDLAH